MVQLLKIYGIDLDEEEKRFIDENNLHNFRQVEVYESLKDMARKEDKPKISKLYGNNGEIDEREFENFCKFSIKN